MIKILNILIVLFLISGCTGKTRTVIQKEYIKEDPYLFQTVDLKGAYIESKDNVKYSLGSAEVMQICTPLLQELNTIYKETKSFYDDQIEDYKKLNKKEIK